MRFYLILIVVLFICASNAFAQQQLRPGTPAPDFAAEATDGTFYSLSQLQGKVVVLTFWTTRCEICHNEIPKLNRLADHYRGQDVVFLAPTTDGIPKVEQYVRKTPFAFSIVPNSFAVMLKYADMDKSGNINMGFPAYFIIDRRGAIALRTYGWDKTENLNAQISKLLASD
jgi:peroxiredoxin